MNKKTLKIIYSILFSFMVRDLIACESNEDKTICQFYTFQNRDFKNRVASLLGSMLGLDAMGYTVSQQNLPDVVPIISISPAHAVKLLEKVENQELEDNERISLEQNPAQFFRRLYESGYNCLDLKSLNGYSLIFNDANPKFGIRLDAVDDLLARIIARDKLAKTEKTIAALVARVQVLTAAQAVSTTFQSDESNSK